MSCKKYSITAHFGKNSDGLKIPKAEGYEQQVLLKASHAALASLLNLTLFPVLGFLYLMLMMSKTERGTIARYHVLLGLKINLTAAVVLLCVSALMIVLGGFNSPWTWVFVILYFTLIHTVFIIFAVWALVRSWSGEKLKSGQ